MSHRTVISDEYRAQQLTLHEDGNYGVAGQFAGDLVGRYLRRLGARSILDYGCGSKRSLLKGLDLPPDVVYEGYDPCVPEFAAAPCPAELVVCIDVLEHVEPLFLDNVLDHLGELCDPYGLFTVETGPAKKLLPDGRNAHLIQENLAWWKPRLEQRFELLEVGQEPRWFAFVRAKPK